jgi:hypothetical protein
MTQTSPPRSDVTWPEISRRYFEIASEAAGTPTDLMFTVRGYVRQWARAMLRADPSLEQKELSQRFSELADRCYKRACLEEWTNAHGLNLGSVVRKSVMEVKV